MQFRLPPEKTHRIATNLGVDSSYFNGGGRFPTAAFGPLATVPFPFALPFPLATRGVRSLAPGIVLEEDERVGDWAKTNRDRAEIFGVLTEQLGFQGRAVGHRRLMT